MNQMNQLNLDDLIIPPPTEFADIPPINDVINTNVIRKQGDPESNPIQYILEEQNQILNYLNLFQNIKYKIELKVIFVNTSVP